MGTEVQIKIEGSEFSNNDVIIKEITVEKSTGFEASYCKIVFVDNVEKLSKDQSFSYTSVSTKFELCKKIEILAETENIFVGFIMEKKFVQKEGISELHIIGGDIKYIMMNNSDFKIFNDCKYHSDAAKNVFSKYSSIPVASEVKDSFEIDHDIIQCNVSDYDFLVDLAKKIGYKFFLEDGKIYFVPISEKSDGSDIDASSTEYTVEEVSVRRSAYSKVDKVTVSSHSTANTGKSLESEAASASDEGEGDNKFKNLKNWSLGGVRLEDNAISTSSEAAGLAAAFIQQKSMETVEVHGTIIGFISLKLNSVTNFKKFESPVDGQYKISEIIYKLEENGFRTEITAKSNSANI